MISLPKIVGVMSYVSIIFLVTLSGCQSTTGKTARQTISDTSISTAVQAKLTNDRLSNFPRIDVDTERGVVNLSGVVQTEAQRTQAARLARQVDGVVKVNNNLQVENRPSAGQVPSSAKSDGMQSSHSENKSAHAGQKDMTLQEQGVSLIRGEVIRVEGDHYVVKSQDGREVSFRADTTTMKTETVKTGDRIEAKVDDNNHALSLLPAP